MKGYAKAIVGALIAGIAALGGILNVSHGQFSTSDAGVILGAVIAGFHGVYWSSNSSDSASVDSGDSSPGRQQPDPDS